MGVTTRRARSTTAQKERPSLLQRAMRIVITSGFFFVQAAKQASEARISEAG
jgi:hypothetical protein